MKYGLSVIGISRPPRHLLALSAKPSWPVGLRAQRSQRRAEQTLKGRLKEASDS
jgi:hypothetical protein